MFRAVLKAGLPIPLFTKPPAITRCAVRPSRQFPALALSVPTISPGLGLISLWGADGFNINGETYENATFGVDLRIEVATTTNDDVPEPGALLVFATALITLRVVRGTSRKIRA